MERRTQESAGNPLPHLRTHSCWSWKSGPLETGPKPKVSYVMAEMLRDHGVATRDIHASACHHWQHLLWTSRHTAYSRGPRSGGSHGTGRVSKPSDPKAESLTSCLHKGVRGVDLVQLRRDDRLSPSKCPQLAPHHRRPRCPASLQRPGCLQKTGHLDSVIPH